MYEVRFTNITGISLLLTVKIEKLKGWSLRFMSSSTSPLLSPMLFGLFLVTELLHHPSHYSHCSGYCTDKLSTRILLTLRRTRVIRSFASLISDLRPLCSFFSCTLHEKSEILFPILFYFSFQDILIIKFRIEFTISHLWWVSCSPSTFTWPNVTLKIFRNKI